MTETPTAALRGLFTGIAGLFGKDGPTAGDVHVDVPLGADGKPKKKPKEVEIDKVFTKANVVKVDAEHGLVFGFALVCKDDGQDYFDTQNDHVPEDAMLKASLDFMQNSRMAKEMHAGDAAGSVVFAFPLTTDIAKALGIETAKTGLLIAMKPDPEMLAKFKDGTLSGFSIGGQREVDEDVA